MPRRSKRRIPSTIELGMALEKVILRIELERRMELKNQVEELNKIHKDMLDRHKLLYNNITT